MRAYSNFTSARSIESTNSESRKKTIQLSAIAAHLNVIFHRFLRTLAGDSEVQISQKRDRAGNLFWKVYDPATGYSTRLNSEQEVRTWLEQRYQF